MEVEEGVVALEELAVTCVEQGQTLILVESLSFSPQLLPPPSFRLFRKCWLQLCDEFRVIPDCEILELRR
jgi:hypothetical protein